MIPTHCPGIITDPPESKVIPLCQDCTKRTAPWREARIHVMLPPDSAWDGQCKERTPAA